MSRNSLFENMRTGFSRLEILQEPASHEYQLKKWDLKNFETILMVDCKKTPFVTADGQFLGCLTADG